MKAFLLRYHIKYQAHNHEKGKRVQVLGTERLAYFSDKALLQVYCKQWTNPNARYVETKEDKKFNDAAPEILVQEATNSWEDRERPQSHYHTHYGISRIITPKTT